MGDNEPVTMATLPSSREPRRMDILVVTGIVEERLRGIQGVLGIYHSPV